MVEVKKPTLSVRVHITLEDIENLLYSAAQGSDYWCSNAFKLGYENVVKAILEGKGVTLFDAEEDDKSHLIDFKKVKRGLTAMAKHERTHFCDLINDNADMVTGDVFLQCCLFGKTIYS